MEAILTAIVDDDRTKVKELLKANPILAKSLIEKARLYESKIVHWIYAGDTALHLASAGHRVELVRLLLAAGANPNSAENHRHSGPLRRMATSTAPIGMQRGKCRQSNACSTPEPTFLRRTKMARRPCTEPSAPAAPPR
jgi:hypothetical protein